MSKDFFVFQDSGQKAGREKKSLPQGLAQGFADVPAAMPTLKINRCLLVFVPGLKIISVDLAAP